MPQISQPGFRFGEFFLNAAERRLLCRGENVPLTPKAFDTLLLLVKNAGHLVEKEAFLKQLWPDVFVEESSLAQNISGLRKVLGDDGNGNKFIETMPKRGYRFVAEVREQVEDTVSKGNGVGAQSATLSVVQTVGQERSSAAEVQGTKWHSARVGLYRALSLVAGVAVLVLMCTAVWHSQPQPPTVTNMVRITNDGKAKNPTNSPVTDGVHLYFTEGLPRTSGSGIAQVSAAGGETTWITTLKDVWAVNSISPDGSELLVAKSGTGVSDHAIELWVQPLPAGAPHRAGNILAPKATWTPDGAHIVYADGDKIMLANKDGSGPHQLAKVSGWVNSLRFSPDGRRIRFDLFDPRISSNSIWEMDANGSDIHPLFPDWKGSPYQCCGNWSPDGDYYYFQATNENAQDIWVMPESRSIIHRSAKGPSRLTSGPLRFSSPVPSFDGKRLFVLGEEPRVELLRYNLQSRRFDYYLPGLSAGPVDFSFDRKWIAYISYPDMTLWRSRLDGSDKMQLTFPPVRAYQPRWSPDGSQIVFTDVQFGRPWKIWLVSPTGGTLGLLPLGNTKKADPTWMPDGKSIVFGEPTSNGNVAIYRIDLKTKKVSSIPGSDGLTSPRLSPDGRYISALTKSQTKLMLFDTNTNHWSSLAEGQQVGYNEWSHDGKYVYMRENWGGAGELVRVRIKDRALEHVLSFKDFPQLADIFAAWIGLTPDDAPLLMRDRSVQEIYALDLRFH
jgi:DNA-binding winged helix-turn-helix (wHTH) protein/Tol biopolymer transport system component